MIKVLGTDKDGVGHHLAVKHGTVESVTEHLRKIQFRIEEVSEVDDDYYLKSVGATEGFAEHD